MTTPAVTQDVEGFIEHFGARGMRWGRLDASSRAEELGSAPFIKLAGSAPGQGAVQTRQGEEAQAAAEESKTADQESAAALQQLASIHSEQTAVAVQAHVAAATAAQAAAKVPSAATATAATQTAAQAAAEKADLAQVAAANKEAAAAVKKEAALQTKLNKLEAKEKTAAAKAKVAKAKAVAKKLHAAKLKAIAKKAKEAHEKHKASKAKPLTAKQKAAKAAYEKAHPEKHKPLTAAQEAKKKAEEKAAELKKAKAKPVVKKAAATKTATTKTAAKPVVTKVEAAARTKLAANAEKFSHGIENAGALLPHDRPVQEGGPVANAPSAPATKQPSAAARRMFAKMGLAMPDGSYYIRNGAVGASDLQNAIQSVGRGENAGKSGAAIRQHIMKRAAALKLSSKIPDSWNTDGTLKQADIDERVDNFLAHFGVKGMKWGVRRGHGSSSPGSPDHEQVKAITAKIKSSGGIHALSNSELKAVTDRLGLESNYSRLVSGNKSEIAKGQDFVKTLTSYTKTGLDALSTGQQVVKTVNDLKKAATAA